MNTTKYVFEKKSENFLWTPLLIELWILYEQHTVPQLVVCICLLTIFTLNIGTLSKNLNLNITASSCFKKVLDEWQTV